MHTLQVLSFILLVVALSGVTEASRRHTYRNRRQISWRPNFRVPTVRVPKRPIPQIPNIRIPEVKIPEIRIPDVKLPDFRIPDVKIPDIKVPEIPEIHVPDIPDIHVPDVPRVEVSDFPVREFHDTLRPVSEWFRQLSNRRFNPSFSRHNGGDWKLTWGWFNKPEVRPEVKPRPGPVHPDAGIGGRGEGGDRFGSRVGWPFRDMDGGAGAMNPRWQPGSWHTPMRPMFPRPGPSDTFFHTFRDTFPDRQHHPHHIPHHPIAQPPHRPGGAGPSYDSLCHGRHYSARRYESSTWVSATVVNGTSMDVLRRIKEYFNGANDQVRIMLMSRPLRMTVTGVNGTISDTEDTVEEFRLSALVPTGNQRAPMPTDPMLNISSEPRQVYFATHFRLHRRPGTLAIYDEFFQLQDATDLAGELFEHGIYHTAFYETWADIATGSTRPQPGEILIPAASGESLVCTRQETPSPQNGIEQCGESRCPTYEHLDQLRDDVELRRIKGGTYITRTAPACTMVLPAFVSHCSLKRYLAGANSEGQRYPSPAPFIHYVFPSRLATSLCKLTAISAYMLPPNTTAAEPTEYSSSNRRDMRIRTIPDIEAFVLKFGGRPNQRTVESKVDELRDFLGRQGLGHCLVRDKYAVAVYDHPFNRPPYLNEILVFKKVGPCRSSDFNGTITDDVPEEDSVDSTVPTSSTSRMTTESPRTEPILFEEEFEPSTTMAAVDETTSVRKTTPEPDRVSTSATTTQSNPLIEINLTLESNSVELDRDLIPYRFSGNQTDFPEDFPVDIFVF
ncbi:uncharacterized protein LOC576824 [Strongylocentrotus purpuratus]|uniref:Uncharacterized protein n=1 Tax=Strongylocentrotus purpuratus TaxID=7668 RepID=A0A7M7RDD0_STRPU|nr:uncharacterized protein LOC576824 [Strongylocentrotus purpuratus]